MKRFFDLLSPLGLGVIIGSIAWARAGKTLPGEPRYYLIGGLVLILAHLLLRLEDIVRAVGRRQMKYGSNMAVLILVVLGILGTGNYLAYRHSKRWDLTKGQRYSLSDQTRKIVGGLRDEVKISYFQRKVSFGEAQSRLEDYRALSPKLKLEFVDPVQNPARARDYEITTLPTLVVERAGRREKISSDSEQDLTNALIKITREGKKSVCFAEGEGEKDIEDFGDQGFSGAKTALTKSQYETRRLVLLRERIPESCTVLVLAGPQKDLLPAAADSLRGYVKGGGKALVLLEPELKGPFPSLEAMLKEWNLEAGKNVVLDVSLQSQLAGTGPMTPLAAQYPYHEITRDFRLATAFHTARSMKAGSATIEGVHAQNLVETSPDSWAESDLQLKEPVQFDQGRDQKGPVSLGAVATVTVAASPSPSPPPAPSPSPEEASSKPEGRVVAFGDSDFASNSFLGFPGNQDLFLNAVAWLSQDTDLISIRPKEPEDQRLFLTREQQLAVALVSLLLLPGFFVVLGIFNWWRRR